MAEECPNVVASWLLLRQKMLRGNSLGDTPDDMYSVQQKMERHLNINQRFLLNGVTKCSELHDKMHAAYTSQFGKNMDGDR